jgi:hypothetical protein
MQSLTKKHFSKVEKMFKREEKLLFMIENELTDLEEEIAIIELSTSYPNPIVSTMCQRRDELFNDHEEQKSIVECLKRDLKLNQLQLVKRYLSTREVENADHFAKEILGFVWKY